MQPSRLVCGNLRTYIAAGDRIVELRRILADCAFVPSARFRTASWPRLTEVHMKPTTLALVACAFVSGLAVGLSGPVAKAGDGLLRIVLDGSTRRPQADRITASVSSQRAGFQQTNFRWSAQPGSTVSNAFCAPKDELPAAAQPAIQRL